MSTKEIPFLDVLNYVTSTYNVIVNESVAKLELRHTREVGIIETLTYMSPVEESRMIRAIPNGLVVTGEIINPRDYIENKDHNEMLNGLLQTHSSRWLVDGYNSTVEMNRTLKHIGLFGQNILKIPNSNQAVFSEEFVSDDYMLYCTRYTKKDNCVNNYLIINSLDGGMSLMCKSLDYYILFSIIPRHTRFLNAESDRSPTYIRSTSDDVIVYSVRNMVMNVVELGRRMNASPRAILGMGESASIVLTQAYQRQLGARGTVVDDDEILCALGELVKGSWSVHIGYRVTALFIAWITSKSEVTPLDVNNVTDILVDIIQTGTDLELTEAETACSSVWSFLRETRILQGSSIDSSRVMRICEVMGRNTLSGGRPSMILSMLPRELSEVTSLRGKIDVQTFLRDSIAVLHKPRNLRGENTLVKPGAYHINYDAW